MASGHQLHNLFVIILHDCSPSDPLALWMQFRDRLHWLLKTFLASIKVNVLHLMKLLRQ
jgi:hypothetical protein